MKSLRREIAAIAFPAIISNITTPLLAMIDVAIVGHIGSAAYIGAIAIGSSMFNMIYWLFGFLRMGSSGITAQTFGAGKLLETGVHLYRALTVGLLVGVLIFCLGHPIADIMLSFMDADTSTEPLARRYFLIAITGAPATLGTYALSGWLLGMQNSRIPMFIALLTNVVNIVLSLLLVFGLGMRIEGVAIGSATAQWCGFVYGLSRAKIIYRPFRPTARTLFAWMELKRFFSINTDIFLRTLCLVAVTVWFTRAGSGQGVDVLAANALLLQLFMFFSYFMDGFAFAGEALSGKFAGAKNNTMLKALISRLTQIGIFLAILFSLLYLVFGYSILNLLTDDKHVLDVCMQFKWWAIAIPLTGTMAFVWDGILIGLSRTRIMLLSMFGAAVLFFFVYFLFSPGLGNHGLWLAFASYLAARGILEQILYYFSSKLNNHKFTGL